MKLSCVVRVSKEGRDGARGTSSVYVKIWGFQKDDIKNRTANFLVEEEDLLPELHLKVLIGDNKVEKDLTPTSIQRGERYRVTTLQISWSGLRE